MKSHLMLLIYHNWQENKTRMYIATALLMAIIMYACNQAGGTIEQHPFFHGGKEINFTQYVWVILYKGDFLTIYTLSSFIFGIGGPAQEKLNGSALFTLSLPIYRKTIIRAKLLAAALQVVLLALLTAFVIPLIALLFGFTYPVKDALLFSLLMSGGGLLIMLLGFCLSLFISRQIVVIPLGVSLMAATFFITRLPSFKQVNIFNFMTGAGYLGNDDFLFNQDVNIRGLAIITCVLFLSSIFLEQAYKRMDL